jgi:hypothetical protein
MLEVCLVGFLFWSSVVLHGCLTSQSTGEDALANLSIEKTEAGIVGHVRIRSKTQGIALSLGDRITMCKYPLHSTFDIGLMVMYSIAQKDNKPSIQNPSHPALS